MPRPTPAEENSLTVTQVRRLLLLRSLSVLVMLACTLLLPPLLGMTVPALALLSIIFALAAITLLTLGILAAGGNSAFSFLARPFVQLLIDIGGWSFFLFFTGGATNPLISILLPLVAIGAAILPTRHAWLIALVSIVSYSVLWNHFMPLPITNDSLAMHWHLTGMWLTFALSAVVIVFFIVRMNTALRERDAALADANAAIARDEQIVALGNMAAGTAHNLGTPLGTLRILVDELLRAPPSPDDLRSDLQLMGTQLDHCRNLLSQLTAEAGRSRAEGGSTVTAAHWVHDTLSCWQSQRPGVPVGVNCAPTLDSLPIIADTTLSQALHTLVNNAADAQARMDIPSGQQQLPPIRVKAWHDATCLFIEVRDHGCGMSEQQRMAAGHSLQTDGNGMGIGLFLARRALAGYGGELVFSSPDDTAGPIAPANVLRGTVARMQIPLGEITP